MRVRSSAEGWNFILMKLHNILWGRQTPLYHYVTIIDYCRMNAPAKIYGFSQLKSTQNLFKLVKYSKVKREGR